MSYNNIQEEGVEALMIGLCVNKILQKLNLGNNGIKDRSISFIENMLRNDGNGVKKLHINSCMLPEERKARLVKVAKMRSKEFKLCLIFQDHISSMITW